MGLTSCKIRDCVKLYSESCGIPNLTNFDVSGISRDKEFFEPSKQVGEDTSEYKVVPPNYFACNLMHVGRDRVLPIALNHSDKNKYVSPAYTIFSISDDSLLLKEYFFMMLKSDERDRYFWMHTDTSVREGMPWDDFSVLEIQFPSVEIQQKYVNIYKAMVANQKAYESGLEDLKLVCDGCIEDLRRRIPCKKIGPYIRECDEKNESNEITLFQGVNVDHVFTEPKRVAEDSENGCIVRTGQFAFNKVMKANNTKLPIALREGPDCVVSNSYQVFEVVDKTKLNPKYLLLWFNRAETQRYAGFLSFGTTRDIFTFEHMKDISIPIPSVDVQHSVADIFEVFQERQAINERLKAQIKDICPILIKGSLEEAEKESAMA